ncbi:copper transporter [Kineococcus terrestris]|uniref:copper transporter n=1 Tax=Kineococcus terrestris TaxID=2044856 RepID=UPI0034DB73A2
MIDFRYHVVSLVSVFLALAVGIVLGAGPLNEGISVGITDQVRQLTQEQEQLRTERDQAQAALAAREEWAATVAPALVARQLGGRAVAVVELPGADADVTDEAVAVLEAAGATVASRVAVSADWVDPALAADRADLAGRLSAARPGTGAGAGEGGDEGAQQDAGAPDEDGAAQDGGGGDGGDGGDGAAAGGDEGAQDVLAGALAAALVVPDLGTEAPGPVAGEGLQALVDAGLVEVRGEPAGPASLALLVAGPAPDVEGDAEAAEAAEAGAAAWTTLAARFDAASAGALLAGPAGSADEGGAVAAVRADADVAGAVSTVDDLDSASGRVSAVLGLREQLSGDAGQYGTASTADALSPPLPAVAAP